MNSVGGCEKVCGNSNGQLSIGTCIRIKRSDGTIHDAVICEIRKRERSIMAEWAEGNEYKGKEISFNDMYHLNPHLLKQDPQRQTILARQRSQHCSLRESEDGAEIRRLESTAAVGNVARTPPDNNRSVVAESPAGHRSSARSDKDKDTSAPPVSRMSAVREIERLKKNRDLRRLAQAKKREERKTLIKLHQGNPNWEYQCMINDYRNKSLNAKKVSDGSVPVETHQITVCVRKRPMNQMELSQKDIDVITVADRDTVIVHEPKCKVDLSKFIENQMFKFDYVFDEFCDNEIVYRYTAKPLVESIFEGGVATCFAYGQTGSGKTYTMGGAAKCNGIYAKTAFDVFSYLKSSRFTELELKVSASFFEIYREKLYDLLESKKPLRVLEDMHGQVQVIGLSEKEVDGVEDVLDLIREGNSTRTQGKTTVNQASSRSHAVFQLTLKKKKTNKMHGKFCLIDLAGNERGGQSVSKRAKVEGADINKSLLALKECIRALGRKDPHLPFRGSKLTQVLRDAFMGDKARTCMIAMVPPGLSACKNTLNTLRYADRVKELIAGDLSSCEDNNPVDSSLAAVKEGISTVPGDDDEEDDDDEDDDEEIENKENLQLVNVENTELLDSPGSVDMDEFQEADDSSMIPIDNQLPQSSSIDERLTEFNYKETKQNQLRIEFYKYMTNSVDWNQRETQLQESLQLGHLANEHFMDDYFSVLTDRYYHIRNLLNLGQEIRGINNMDAGAPDPNESQSILTRSCD